jgi:dihydropteroate synthase
MTDRESRILSLLRAADDATRPPLVMGVVNVTPDSFHDGGRHADPDAAVAWGLALAEAGADIVDIGGESTRPGASEVPARVERDRVLAVVSDLAGRGIAVTIDTRRASVAAAAVEAGAIGVNDVSGFAFDSGMIPLLAAARPLAIAMHMRGNPADMQTRTGYRSVADDVASELRDRVRAARDGGVPTDRLWVDPGIGFAKTAEQCVELLARLDAVVGLGLPVVAGVSRKSFIGKILGRPDPAGRVFGTAAAVALAVDRGARVLRVHDVSEMSDVIRVAHAIRRASRGGA